MNEFDVSLPDEFCVVTDYIKDVLLDIRYFSTFNFVGARVDGYLDPVAILTKKAVSQLEKACVEFKKHGYIIKIYDAYRPQSAVDHFVRWGKDVKDLRTKEYFYPEIDKAKCFELDFIATRSSHSRGSTIDLTLFDEKTGMDLDMGGPFDYFGDLSHADYKDITKVQYDNRMLLREVMIKYGFRPFNGEWWHFTLIDEPFKDTYFNFPVKNYKKV